MQWGTREHPKTDRIACPWPIPNYSDPDAEVVYVPDGEVLGTPSGWARQLTPPARSSPTEMGRARYEVLMPTTT